MSCCSNPYNFGCYGSCSSIRTGVDSDFTGTLTGHFEFAGITVAIDIDVVVDEPIIIPLNGINETAKFTLTLYDEDGDVYPLEIDDTSYTCFEFKTKVVYNSVAEISEDANCCDPVVIEVDGESEYIIQASEWSQFGSIPSIEVIVKESGVYTSIPVNWVPDSMPDPTTITINIGGVPPDPWYIRLK